MFIPPIPIHTSSHEVVLPIYSHCRLFICDEIVAFLFAPFSQFRHDHHEPYHFRYSPMPPWRCFLFIRIVVYLFVMRSLAYVRVFFITATITTKTKNTVTECETMRLYTRRMARTATKRKTRVGKRRRIETPKRTRAPNPIKFHSQQKKLLHTNNQASNRNSTDSTTNTGMPSTDFC